MPLAEDLSHQKRKPRTEADRPDPPRKLEATTIAHDRIDLKWIPPLYDGGAPILEYSIEASNDEREWRELAVVEGLEFVHLDPVLGVVWHYRVRAENESGISDPSNIASAMIDDPVGRANRVNEAVLPWFTGAMVSSSIDAISTRVQAVARGDLSYQRLNLLGGQRESFERSGVWNTVVENE